MHSMHQEHGRGGEVHLLLRGPDAIPRPGVGGDRHAEGGEDVMIPLGAHGLGQGDAQGDLLHDVEVLAHVLV